MPKHLLSFVLTYFICAFSFATSLDSKTNEIAEYAANTYKAEMIASLAHMVSYNTVAQENVSIDNSPEHVKFKQFLASEAKKLGLDYQDHGYTVIIGLGEGSERVGIITHGDIQPVNPSKWKKSPFELDATSEPGKLIGRGTEDDKGPIATALYAMKAIKDQAIPLKKRLELYVYMAEESDWQHIVEFLKTHTPPSINITIDAEYPVVTAEKGYGTISATIPVSRYNGDQAYIKELTGGFFGSQIPEDASVTIVNANSETIAAIKANAKLQQTMHYSFAQLNNQFTIVARGKSAHSSKPEEGVNAITHLAEALNFKKWPATTAGNAINFINDLLGTGLYGDKFGDIAYSDDFMGHMTVSPTVLKNTDKGLQININIRRPVGKTVAELTNQINQAVSQWQNKNSVTVELTSQIGEPFVQTEAPHIPTLLNVFSHFTGIKDAKPIAIGGGTNSRLFPNAVSFGPSMPNAEYTGHSEHEFITVDQFVLNLKMYTAVFVELAK